MIFQDSLESQAESNFQRCAGGILMQETAPSTAPLPGKALRCCYSGFLMQEAAPLTAPLPGMRPEVL